MSPFKAQLTEKTDHFHLEISGPLDENLQLPKILKSKALVISFQDVTLMSSAGIRNWCLWTRDHSALPSIRLQRCPFVVAKNFSMIKGMLGSNMSVHSFYVPFYGADSHESKQALMELDKDFTSDGFYKIPKVTDSMGSEMEIDVEPIRYFQFLKRK